MNGRRLSHVVVDLSRIVDETSTGGSYLAVFPALYRAVTIEIQRGLDSSFFAVPDRLERLAVVFADRYIDAFDAYRRKEATTASWRYAFDRATSRRRRMIVQHLLLGMNAHINLDLGIATVEASTKGALPELYDDFLRVNEILFARIDGLQGGLNEVSPWMRLVDRIGFSWDEAFMRFGIRTARDMAWRLAETLADHGPESRLGDIAERDRDTRRVASLIAGPFSMMQLTGSVVSIKESRDMMEITEALGAGSVDLELVDARVAEQPRTPRPGPASLRQAIRGRGSRSG